MPRDNRRSGFTLILAGLAGVAFFALTDPKWGMLRPSSSPDIVDAMQQAWPGTYIGMAGGAMIVVFGLWLIVRRSA